MACEGQVPMTANPHPKTNFKAQTWVLLLSLLLNSIRGNEDPEN